MFSGGIPGAGGAVPQLHAAYIYPNPISCVLDLAHTTAVPVGARKGQVQEAEAGMREWSLLRCPWDGSR